jgi:hypothetical protein
MHADLAKYELDIGSGRGPARRKRKKSIRQQDARAQNRSINGLSRWKRKREVVEKSSQDTLTGGFSRSKHRSKNGGRCFVVENFIPEFRGVVTGIKRISSKFDRHSSETRSSDDRLTVAHEDVKDDQKSVKREAAELIDRRTGGGRYVRARRR